MCGLFLSVQCARCCLPLADEETAPIQTQFRVMKKMIHLKTYLDTKDKGFYALSSIFSVTLFCFEDCLLVCETFHQQKLHRCSQRFSVGTVRHPRRKRAVWAPPQTNWLLSVSTLFHQMFIQAPRELLWAARDVKEGSSVWRGAHIGNCLSGAHL